MNNIDIAVFLAYCALVVGIALYVSRGKKGEKKDTRDYFVAGNTLPWWAIGTSLIAANISAEQLIGMTGSGYRMGLAIATYEWMAAATLIIVGKFFVPVFLEKRIMSMPEFLKMRYDSRVSTSLAIFWLALYVLVNLTSIMYLGAICIHNVFDVDLSIAVISIAIFSALYTIFGGLKAIAFTDPIQVTFLVLGGLITTYYALNAYGHDQGIAVGIQRLTTEMPEKFHMIFSKGDEFYNELPGLTVLIGAMWVVNLNYWGFNQYITQRALAAKSLDEAQKGIVLAGFLKLLMPLIVVVPGIIAAGLFKAHEHGAHDIINQADETYPYLLNTFLFPGVKGLAFAALVAAIVGSLSSKTNSIATIFTMDVYKPFFGEGKSESHLINVGRMATGLSLVIAVPLAIVIANNIDKLGGGFNFIQEFTGFFSPGIFTIFLFGLFWKRATAQGALSVALATLPVSLVFKFVPFLEDIPFLDRMGYSFLILSGIMVAMSLAKPQTEEERQKSIDIHPTLFKTGPVFNIGAMAIIAAIVVLYTIFW